MTTFSLDTQGATNLKKKKGGGNSSVNFARRFVNKRILGKDFRIFQLAHFLVFGAFQFRSNFIPIFSLKLEF